MTMLLLALTAWSVLGLATAWRPACAASVSVAAANDDEKKSDKDKSKEEKKESNDEEKKASEKEEKEAGTGDSKDKKDGNSKKTESKDAEKEKPKGGGLTDEQLAEMKRILMEKVKQQEEAKKARAQEKKDGPAKEKAPATQPKAPRTTGKPPAPKTDDAPAEDAAADEDEPDPQAGQEDEMPDENQAFPSASQRSSRRSNARAPQGRRSSTGKDSAPEPEEDKPSDREGAGIIMPVDLPEGVDHPWEAPDEWRPYFFSFENVNPKDLIEDWSRMTGLSLIGIENAKGSAITYHSLTYMNYWEALTILNELIEPGNICLIQDWQHMRVIPAGELRPWIRPDHIYHSREAFEAVRPHDPIPVKVFFIPPSNVAPAQVAQWINDLPDSLRLGSSTPGNMHVSGFAKDIRKLFFLVDIVQEESIYDCRITEWIPVDKIDVETMAEYVRDFVQSDSSGPAPSPRGRSKTPGQVEPLEDCSEVDVLAVPRVKMLYVKAKPAIIQRVKDLVEEIASRAPETEDEITPVIIPLAYAQANDIIPLLEAVLDGEAPPSPTRKAPRTPRRKSATPESDTIDLSAGREDIQIIASENTNALIVIADDEGVERVRKLLEIFDIPGSSSTFVRIALEHAEPDAVQQVLTAWLAPQVSGGKGSRDLIIIPEPTSGGLILSGKESLIAKAQELVAELDVPGNESVTHLVTLVNQAPSAMAELLNKMEKGSPRPRGKAAAAAAGNNFIGDDATNTLIVVCPESQWQEIKDLIERLDNAAGPVMLSKVFDIEAADAEQVANLLKGMFGVPQNRRRGRTAPDGIIIEPIGEKIFVRADEGTIDEIAQVIGDMESAVERREETRKTIRLRYATPADAIKVLATFFPPTRPGGKNTIVPPEAQFAPTGNSIVVRATPEIMGEIETLIEQIDVSDQATTEYRTYEVNDPGAVIAALQNIFAQRGARQKPGSTEGPIFTAAGSKLIVHAEPGLFESIEQIIHEFEGEETGPVFRKFTLEYAPAEELAGRVEELLQVRAASDQGTAPAAGRRRRTSTTTQTVKVVADARTGTLFIAAPADVMSYAEEIIRDLDVPTDEQKEGVIVRTVQLKNAEVEDMIGALQKMMSGGATQAATNATARTGPRSFHARMAGKMKGQVSMVPAPGANAVILRGIESDVDSVESLIVAIDESSQSSKKIAKRYSSLETGMVVDELAETLMAVAGGGTTKSAAKADEFDVPTGPMIGKDMIITTDWYTDSIVVVATPEKQAEVDVLLEAFKAETGAGETPIHYPITMYELAHGDPYTVKTGLEEVLDKLLSERLRRKVKITNPEGSRLLAISGPEEATSGIDELIKKLDKPGLKAPPKTSIRSLKPQIPLSEVLIILQQQMPGMDIEVESASLVVGGASEEGYNVEEIKPTLGPGTLTIISARLSELLVAAEGDETAESANPATAVEEDAAPSKIKVWLDAKTGMLRLKGRPEDVDAFNDELDRLIDELDKLPYRPDIRVFRIKYASVNEVAQIMSSVLGAQSGGAVSRAQQALQQQLQMRQQQQQVQQQLQRQRQQQQMQEQMRRMMGGGGGEQKDDQQEAPAAEEEPEKEREDEAKEFGSTRIRVYPDPRTSTIIVRAATEDYPVILELLAKVDKPPQNVTGFKIFKLTKLKASDVEAAINAILGLDRQASRRAQPGQRAGQQQVGGQPQMVAQLQQQINQMQAEVGDSEGVSINWAEDVRIASDAPTNSILASGPDTALAYIEKVIEELEGQEIQKEVVKTIKLVHASVEEILPSLQDVFSGKSASGGAGKIRSAAGGAGREEVVETAFSQVVLTGDSRTNSLIVKALESDMNQVESLIAELDVGTGDVGKLEIIPLRYADATETATSLSTIYVTGDKGKSKLQIIGISGTNSVLLRGAAPSLREEILEQIRVIDDLKGMGSAPRTIPILAANPESIAKKLNEVFGGRGKVGGEVIITGDSSANHLVVVAPNAVFEQIAKLAQAMDTPASESVPHIYELQHAGAEEVLAKLQDMVTQLARNKVISGAGKGVEMDAYAAVADPRTNSLIVIGSPGTHAMIAGVLASIDVAPTDALGDYTMRLVYARADEVAAMLNQYFDSKFAAFRDSGITGTKSPETQVSITPDANSNQIFVVATQRNKEEIDRLLSTIDVEGTAGHKVRIITVKNAGAADVAQALGATFVQGKSRGPGAQTITIANPAGTNTLLIGSDEPTFNEILQVVGDLDRPDDEPAEVVRVVVLENVSADEAKMILEERFRKTGGRGSELVNNMKISASPSNNTVVITGPPPSVEMAVKMVEDFDLGSDTLGDTPRMIRLQHADAAQLAETITNMFGEQKAGPARGAAARQAPKVEALPGSNVLLVRARRSDFDSIQNLVQVLDTEELGLGAGNIEIIQVAQGINLPDTASEVQNLINEMEKQRTQGRKGIQPSLIHIETDERSHALLVTGTPSQIKQVREIVDRLASIEPPGEMRLVIRKPAHRGAADIKQVLDQLIEQKAGSSSTNRGTPSGGGPRPQPNRPQRRGNR